MDIQTGEQTDRQTDTHTQSDIACNASLENHTKTNGKALGSLANAGLLCCVATATAIQQDISSISLHPLAVLRNVIFSLQQNQIALCPA